MATIRPHETTAYSFRQSRFKHVPELPIRCCLVAPSGGGKSTLLVSLLLDIYRLCFNRIYVFSPNANSDISQIWKPVEDYARTVLKQEEPCLYEDFDDSDVLALIERQKKITKLCRDARRTQLFQSCFVVDDLADDARVMRRSQALALLFTKGRHYGCSCFVSIQKWRVVAPLYRVNCTDLFVFKLRSAAELQAIAEESSAQYGQDTTEKLILRATDEKYSFLWLNLRASDPRDLFWLRFQARLIPRS
jgi:hypothetical protein